ncbi:MAG TPA: hypothetical protein VGE66_17440 [Chitinophagaceae bacterium]
MRNTVIHNSDKEAARLRRTLALYNTLPNVFWSVLCLVPITVFCYTLMPPVWFYVFLALSLVPLFPAQCPVRSDAGGKDHLGV